MNRFRRWYDTFWTSLLEPRVDPRKIDENLRRARAQLPAPVFWLLGKAQSGKSSIVRALTGSSQAEVGNGFRPCTRTARLYPFPQEDECFVQFLDTRGLGETHYDPDEDIRTLEQQSHLLLFVVKAMDHAQQSVLGPLRAIRREHPEWPLVVVQTALHEGYPSPETAHVLPYPFGQFPYPASVPHDLARSLAAQRQWFDPPPVAFVPVDLTMAGDGYEPQDYGLGELWQAIETALPLGLRGMLQQSTELRQAFRDAHFREAHRQIVFYAMAAGAAALAPAPAIDIPLVLGIQGKMFHAVARIYNQEVSLRTATEFGSTLGTGFMVRYLMRFGLRELGKFVPVLGQAAAAAYVAGFTYAMGRALCVYFSHIAQGDLPDAETLRRTFQSQFEEGRRRLTKAVRTLASAKEPPT